MKCTFGFILLFAVAFASEIPSLIFELKEISVKASSFYDAGYSYGLQGRELILSRYKLDKALYKKLVPWSQTEEGRREVERVMEIHRKAYPDYMEELRGMADGVGVDITVSFLFTMKEEFSYLVPKKYSYPRENHCSDILLNEENELMILHNEDGVPADRNHTILLHMSIGTSQKTLSEYTAYVYAGQLATAAFGHNAHIAYTMNYLETHQGNTDGIGRNFIARHLLDAKSMKEALDIIIRPDYFVAHNYQLLSLTEREAYDIEVAPFGVYAIYTPMKGRSHFHANMFNIAMVDDVDDDSSIHREIRAKELMPAKSFKEAMMILGDHKDNDYPIYQTGEKAELYTFHTSVYHWETRTLTIYEGNPILEQIRWSTKL